VGARLAGLAAAAALIVAPAAASAQDEGFPAGSETVTSGSVSATLSWEAGQIGAKNATLAITRGGSALFAQKISDVVCDECFLNTSDDVQVVDLDQDSEPEVVVAGTSGEECCVRMGVYDFRTASGGYGELFEDWRGAGFELSDLDRDGQPDIATGDLRFEDVFAGLGLWFLPPTVFHYQHQDGIPYMLNVTRGFPALIRKNAAQAKRGLKGFHRGDPGARGLVTAYVADQYLLGHGSAGLREFDRQSARGILGSPRRAKAFRKRLLRMLHDFDYR
jgi:hypothetical protein